jgi:hypothetical protein
VQKFASILMSGSARQPPHSLPYSNNAKPGYFCAFGVAP